MLFAVLLALGIHALIFNIEVVCSKNKSDSRLKSPVITMILTCQHQPVSSRAKSAIKKPVPQKTKAVQPLRTVKAPVKPETKNLSKPAPVKMSSQKFKCPPELKETKIIEKNDSLKSALPEDILTNKVSNTQVVLEAKPLYRINPPPKYPAAAIRRGYQGTVLLEVLVDKNGRVSDLRVFKSSGYPILDRIAATSVKEWLFEPGMRGGQKVKMWVRIPIRFQLK